MPSEPTQDKSKKNAAQATPATADTAQPKQESSTKAKPAASAGSSAVRKNAPKSRPPRAERPGGTGSASSGLFGAIGQALYLLGFYAECKAVQIWRVLRVALGLLGQLFLWAFGGVFRAIGQFLKGFFRDIAAPFHRFFVGIGNVRKVLSEEKEKGSEDAQKTALKYFGSGVRTYLYLVGNLLKFFLPIAAAFVFGFTVYSVLNLEYNLEITINGQAVGIIADEATFDEARNIVRQRIVAAEDERGAESWIVIPEYRLTGVGRLTTREQLANNLARTVAADDAALVNATGVYVDDRLFVTEDGAKVEQFLEDLKAQYDTGDVEVGFVQDVSMDQDAEALYFATSVRSADEVISNLTSVVREQQTYTANGEENLSDIAHNNDIALSTLLDYNPGLSFEEWTNGEEEEDENATGNDGEDEEPSWETEGEYVPAPGTQLVVLPEQRLVQVQTTRIVYEDELIPYETIVEEDPNTTKGIERTTQVGVNGVQRVAYEITNIDGIETKLPAEGIEVEILEYPVNHIVSRGIYEYDWSTGRGNIEGSGAYIWPVPEYTRQGRGMGPGHRGADINAPANVAIGAIASGTVVEAGWHYSWGNTIVIDHGNGVTSRYAHCNQLNVAVGDAVGQGTIIGLVGSTGYSTGNHLHLEITVNGTLVDPYSYVSP